MRYRMIVLLLILILVPSSPASAEEFSVDCSYDGEIHYTVVNRFTTPRKFTFIVSPSGCVQQKLTDVNIEPGASCDVVLTPTESYLASQKSSPIKLFVFAMQESDYDSDIVTFEDPKYTADLENPSALSEILSAQDYRVSLDYKAVPAKDLLSDLLCLRLGRIYTYCTKSFVFSFCDSDYLSEGFFSSNVELTACVSTDLADVRNKSLQSTVFELVVRPDRKQDLVVKDSLSDGVLDLRKNFSYRISDSKDPIQVSVRVANQNVVTKSFKFATFDVGSLILAGFICYVTLLVFGFKKIIYRFFHVSIYDVINLIGTLEEFRLLSVQPTKLNLLVVSSDETVEVVSHGAYSLSITVFSDESRQKKIHNQKQLKKFFATL